MGGLYLLSIFMIGMLGSVHCVGMCGGIVSAFSLTASRRVFPVAVTATPAVPAVHMAAAGELPTALAYNLGRIASYASAGAIAGGLAQGARALTGISTLQIGAYWIANLLLVAIGLYLTGVWKGLAGLERVGGALWRRIQPFTGRLLPLDSLPKAVALGALWGWLPCGMVYSVLLTAMLSGTALSGALVMAAFGLGTLPTLLTMSLFGARLKTWMQRRIVRVGSGLIVAGFGLLGILRAANGLPGSWLDAVCVSIAAGVMQVRL
jgi:sulfite exporter TauE/SafE